MLLLLLWAVLIGGMPASGYYLFQYGKQLYARKQEQRQQFTAPDVASAMWRKELAFGVWICVWASFGLAIVQVLKAVDPIQ